MRRDLFLIERADPLRARAEIVSLVAERLPGHFDVDPVRDIQVFAPVYRGELGIDALNLALREALNPDGRPVRGGRLRIGDKLMMTGRNLHELGLMNGTVLTLLDEVSGSDGDDAALLLAGEESVFRVPIGGIRPPAARLRVLGAPRAGHRTAGRGDRRPPGRGRVLPAARDALHRRDPGPDWLPSSSARARWSPAPPARRTPSGATAGSRLGWPGVR